MTSAIFFSTVSFFFEFKALFHKNQIKNASELKFLLTF